MGAKQSGSPATVGSGVSIRLSSLPNAGNGLFASRDFVRGELITEVREGLPRAGIGRRALPARRCTAAPTAPQVDRPRRRATRIPLPFPPCPLSTRAASYPTSRRSCCARRARTRTCAA